MVLRPSRIGFSFVKPVSPPPSAKTASAAEHPIKPSPRRRRSLFATGGLVCLQITTILATIVRLTVADRYRMTAPLFYAAPLPVLTAACCLAGCGLLFRQKRLAASYWLILSVTCGIGWHRSLFYNKAKPTTPTAMQTVFWNAHGGSLGWSNVVDEIQHFDPDILGLVEAGGREPDRQTFWQDNFPEHDVSILGHGMVVLAKGRIQQVEAGKLSPGSHYRIVDVFHKHDRVRVVLVDIESNPLRSRRMPLKKLINVLQAHPRQPILLMGDFNTPTDSTLLEELRSNYANAFESAGEGYAATWPIPLPVLAIDQVWANSQLQILSCRNQWSWCSDHRPVQTAVAVTSR